MSHLLIAISEDSVQEIFYTMRDRAVIEDVNRRNFRWGYVEVDFKGRLARGDVYLDGPGRPCPRLFPLCLTQYPNGRLHVRELDIYWEKLKLRFAFNIPKACVGGDCLVSVGGNCQVRAPEYCVFDDNPDVVIELPLELIFSIQELSLIAGPRVVRTETAPRQFQWEVYFSNPQIDFDFIDLADIAGDFVARARDFVMDLLSDLPQWAKDAIIAIFGGIEQLLRRALDLQDDLLDEWILDKFELTMGLSVLFLDEVKKTLDENPVFQLDDPFDAGDPPKFNLVLPIDSLDAKIANDEIVVSASVGDNI